MSRRSLIACAGLIGLALAPRLGAQDYEVRLKRAWVNKYADRASIDAVMDVRHTHKSANGVEKGGDDGDLHFSGVASAIGLPFVGEIVNAGLPSQQPAVAAVVAKQKSGQTLRVSGAWRLWFEHPSKTQTQGGNNKFTPNHTNPDHSFEIHPVSRVDQLDLGRSFIPVAGYTAYTPEVAFDYFDKGVVTVKASSSGISIRSRKLKYNYVEFEMELTQAPRKVSDGYVAVATVMVGGDEVAANGPRRMIFVGGTRAAEKVANASAGDRFRVLGIPRLDLMQVLALVKKNGTKQFQMPLPYEMIIVGVR